MTDRMASNVTYLAELKIPKRKGLGYKRLIGRVTMYKRSRVSLKENKGFLLVTINADDITALRASANSIIRDIQIIEKASRI